MPTNTYVIAEGIEQATLSVDAAGTISVSTASGTTPLPQVTTVQFTDATLAIPAGSTSGTDATSPTAFAIGHVGTTITLAATLSYGGSVTLTGAVTLNVAGFTLTLAGPVSFTAGAGASPTLTGAGGVLVTTGTTSLSGLTLGGSTTWKNSGTVTATGTLAITPGSGQAGALTNLAGGTVDLAGDVGITGSGGGMSSLTNAGTLAKTSGTGVSHIAVNTTDTGTLSVAGGNLRFDGAQNSFSGTYVGPGMIDYGFGSTAALGTIAMTAKACSTNLGTVNQSGVVSLGDGSTLTNIATAAWNFTGDAGLALAPGSSSPLLTNYGTLAKTGGTETTVVAIDVTDSGTVTVASGTLAFTGPTTTFGGAIGGAGRFAIGGGSSTLGTGAAITTSAFSVTGGAAVTLAASLGYSGIFSTAAGTSLALGGQTLTLGGTATVAGTVSGSGTLLVTGSLDVSGSVGGGAVLQLGTGGHLQFDASQSGATLAFGTSPSAVTVTGGSAFGDAIAGFAAGDGIDFTGTAFSTAYETVFTASAGGGTLQVRDTAQANAVVGTLTLSGSPLNGVFTLASDGAAGTMLGFAATPALGIAAGDREVGTFGVTGQPYTGAVDLYSPAGQLVSALYTGVAGPYTAFAYDYAGGLFAGSRFTFTAVPPTAAYSSYETDFSFAGTYQGAKFFTTQVAGQIYAGEEVDTDASGAATRVLLTGVTGQPYQSLELDYAAAAYTGYKTFATGITGRSYTGLEEDVTSANAVAKVVYTGMTGAPYSSVEQDYANGTLATTVYDLTGTPGQGFTACHVTENAAGTTLSEIIDRIDGTHRIVGFAANLTLESVLNDKITGGGASETFAFTNVFGHDTITDFAGHMSGAGHDTIALQAADFGSFAAVLSSAHNVSGGVAFAGASGSQITLSGLDKTTLAGLGSDFRFT